MFTAKDSGNTLGIQITLSMASLGRILYFFIKFIRAIYNLLSIIDAFSSNQGYRYK